MIFYNLTRIKPQRIKIVALISLIELYFFFCIEKTVSKNRKLISVIYKLMFLIRPEARRYKADRRNVFR